MNRLIVASIAAVAALSAQAAVACGFPDSTYARVFFDWDSVSLTPDAASVLDDVVKAASQDGEQVIQLDGYTDRAGSAKYNLAKSARMAESVRAYLVAKGVAAERIKVVAHGETDLLVQTRDGVRNPQNRRVEVTFL